MRTIPRTKLSLSRLPSLLPTNAPCRFSQFARCQSTSTAISKDDTKSASAPLPQNPRWLSDARSRIGKCINFGLGHEQTQEAGAVLQEMADHWRELVAGSEGFLASKDQAGLYRQEVVWGEMDSMVMARILEVPKQIETPPYHVAFLNFGHLFNNVVYNRYAESARVNWILRFAAADKTNKKEWLELMTPKSKGLILRSIKTDYKFPMTYPDRVTVLHKLRNKPKADSDHFLLDVLILSERHRRAAARCEEDIVVYDYKLGSKAPMQPFMVSKLQQVFELQEQAKRHNVDRVRRLLEQVRGLEKASWDRPDAKEDFGAAAAP